MTEHQLIQELVSRYRFSELSARIGIRAKFRCEFCGENLLEDLNHYAMWQNDHLFPQSLGPSEDLEESYALSCMKCNFIKRHWVPQGQVVPYTDRKLAIELVKKYLSPLRQQKEQEVTEIKSLWESFCATAEG